MVLPLGDGDGDCLLCKVRLNGELAVAIAHPIDAPANVAAAVHILRGLKNKNVLVSYGERHQQFSPFLRFEQFILFRSHFELLFRLHSVFYIVACDTHLRGGGYIRASVRLTLCRCPAYSRACCISLPLCEVPFATNSDNALGV